MSIQVKQCSSAGSLTLFQRLCYGVGHVLNDLAASMWLSYLLIFLHQVEDFPNDLAGYVVSIGQISDAVFTPLIGWESDATDGIKNVGKRKTWHLLGTLCVMASLPFLFTECIQCSNSPRWAQTIYYAPFAVVMSFGWAATQISHLSFSSEYSPHTHERVVLQSIRNTFTVASNLSVYGIFYLLFRLNDDKGTDSDDLGPADAPKFRNLSLICLGIGTFFNLIFYLGTEERKSESGQRDSHAVEESIENSARFKHNVTMKPSDWLKEHQLHMIGLLYMCTRLYINVSQVYLPMYLTKTLDMDKVSIATLPLICYSSSFLMSFGASYINRMGRKTSFAGGIILGVAASIWLYMVPAGSDQVYGSVILLGAAGSLLLITSLSMTNDLIDYNTESGAFVFGFMSLTDKLSNGVVVLVIQTCHPEESSSADFYRTVQSLVPGISLCVAILGLIALLPQTIGVRRKPSNPNQI